MNQKTKFIRDEVANIILTDESLKDYIVSIISASTNIKREDIDDIKLISSRINSNANVKGSNVDVIYENNDNIINIEVNLNESKLNKAKNMRYLYHLILRQVKRGEKDNYHKVWQINLNNFDIYKKNKFIYRSVIMEESIHIKRSDEIEIIDISLEKLRDISYNEIKEESDNSLEKLLYVFIVEEKETREELYRGNKMMEKVNDKLDEITEEFDGILFYDREEFRRQEAIELGETKAKKEMAKNMLANSEDISKIIKYTGLTIDEIKSLEEN